MSKIKLEKVCCDVPGKPGAKMIAVQVPEDVIDLIEEYTRSPTLAVAQIIRSELFEEGNTMKDCHLQEAIDNAYKLISAKHRQNIGKRGVQDLLIQDWYLILAEEIGEVAQAINDHIHEENSDSFNAIEDELTDAAAVIVAMLTAIPKPIL